MKRTNFKALIVVALLFIWIFSACEKSDHAGDGYGKLKVHLTDAPFPTDSVEEANVTIFKIEIRKASDENEDAEGTEDDEGEEGEEETEEGGNPFIIISEEEMSFNLLDLTNGEIAELVDMEIEAGSYDLIRLYISEASVKLKNGQEYDLKVPSGAQTGLKVFIDPAIVVAGGLSADLLLDFDVSKSFVVQGNPNTPAGIKGFHFKPVIKATNNSTAGTLMGIVTDTLDAGIEGVEVELLTTDSVYTTSFTDSIGGYTILGVEAGTYNVKFAKASYDSVVVENIQIIGGNITTQDAVLTPAADEGGK